MGIALGSLHRVSWMAAAAQALWLHLAVVGTLSALAAFSIGRRRASAGLAALGGLFAAWLALDVGATPSHEGPSLSLVAWNAAFQNSAHAEGLAGLRATDADVLVISELTPEWAEDLRALSPGWPHQALAPADGPHGVGIYSKHPVTWSAVDEVDPDWPRQIVRARVSVGGRDLEVMALHTPSPMGPERFEIHGPAMRAKLATFERTAPRVAMGDLNATPWMGSFHDLCAILDVHDGLRGLVPRGSWPSPLGRLGLPIDHLLVSEGVGVDSARIGPSWGSDHHSVHVQVGWR